MISFLKKNTLSIVIWLLIFPMIALSSEEFIVKDIKIEGLEKISEGALLNYLPVNIGDNLDENRIQESIRSVYSSGFFNTSFEKFTYYNSRKGFVDTDNYFKDPWNQRDINDYIRYMHMPPTMTIMHPMEANTIYDPNRN